MIPDINLLPESGEESSDSLLLYKLLAVVAAIILLFLGWVYFSARGEVQTLQQSVSSLQQQRTALQEQLDLLDGTKVGTYEESLHFIEEVSYPVTPIIIETRDLLMQNAYLREYVFSNEAASIKVDFESLEETSTYVKQLEQSRYFTNVQIDVIEAFTIKGGQDINEELELDFNTMPRYSAEIILDLNIPTLMKGGDR